VHHEKQQKFGDRIRSKGRRRKEKIILKKKILGAKKQKGTPLKFPNDAKILTFP